MGIQGLLPQLKSIMVPIHVKDLRGCSVAVDTYSWLHKGALSCSKELCKGEPTTRHVDYCMHRVNLLRHHGVKPILVFDGGLLPMKSEQETKRSRARKQNLERAIEHESNGNSASAYECYQKAVDISPSVAYELIQVLKKEKVDFVVAPYEADAQMTFLALSKHVDAVITEDSDLIAFGCPRIVFKMDKFGQGVQFQYSMLHQNKELNFTGFTKQMVLEMCILSGCDYLQSLPGMGLKRAHALIQKFKSYEKAIKHLRYNTVSVPPLYEESFKKALWTFQHQRVYDPTVEDIVHLTDISIDLGQDLDFLGPSIPQDLAKGIAIGDFDPITKLPFQGETVRIGFVLDRSYPLEKERKKLDLPAQKNVLTNYFCSASLGAKREFKAPRITPKNFNMEESSPCSEGYVSEGPVAFTLNHSRGPLLDSGNFVDASTPKESVEYSFATDGSQPLESPSGNVRSSEQAALLEPSRHAIYKPCLTLHKERKCEFVSNGVETKTRSVTRKVIVRSSYFQHKMIHKSDLANENEKPVSEEKATNGILCENNIPESDSIGKCFKSALKKRKYIPVETTQTETVNVKCAQTNASLPSKSNQASNSDNKSMEMDIDKGKFGCNISHLSYYSDISEKSMERFVSVVSSFKCTSSGSRASGLRAPLKDVQNTFRNRSTIVPTDLSKFSYVPNNQKTASASLRDLSSHHI